jgi:vancomycin resistance protein VanJ
VPDYLVVATYNMGNGRADPRRLVNILVSHAVEIAAFQEVHYSQVAALQEAVGEKFPHVVIHPDEFAGKAILSRYPLLQPEQLFFISDRPDLKAEVDLGARKLTVISGHPSPPKLRGGKVRFEENSIAQIRRLAETALNAAPAILMGDFNFTDRSQEYRMIASFGLRDAFHEAGSGRGATLPTRIGPWRRMQGLNRLLSRIPLIPVARVDYIWCTGSLDCESSYVGPDTGSDHLPVFAKLKTHA